MSQYLIIFLIVAVFRGVVWVVQKAKESAKAREALMVQSADARMSARPTAPPAVVPPPVTPTGKDLAAEFTASVKGGASAEGRSAKKAVARPKARPAARPPAPPIQAARADRRSALSTTRTDDLSRGAAVPPRSASAAPAPSRAEAREIVATTAARDARRMLRDRAGLRHAVLAREILGPPRGLEA